MILVGSCKAKIAGLWAAARLEGKWVSTNVRNDGIIPTVKIYSFENAQPCSSSM